MRTTLKVTYRGRQTDVPIGDIVYLHADHKCVEVVTEHGIHLVEDSLAQLDREFAGRFVRLHRATLAAKARLQGVQQAADGSAVALVSGCPDPLPVSRRLASSVRAAVKGA